MRTRLLAAAAFALSIVACSGSKTPSGPSATPPAATPPAATTFTLSGTITSTTGSALSGATVRIGDGVNTGRSTTSAANGSYSLTGLTASGFTASASATNYVSVGKGVTLTSSQTVDFQLTPTPLFARNGTGDTVFDVPDTVQRVRVTGVYTGSSSNFIIWIGPQNVACGVVIASGCRLLVNEILGTFGGNRTTYDATLLTGNGGSASVTNTATVRLSSGVSWTFTEVR